MKARYILYIKVAVISFTFSCIVLTTKSAYAQSNEKNRDARLNLMIGTKQLNTEDWDFVAGQKAFGVDIDISVKKWPVDVVAGFIHSQDKIQNLNVKNLALTNEIILGIKKEWGAFLSLYVTGGLSIINARVEGWNGNDTGTGAGAMVGGGINVPLLKRFHGGFLYRYSCAQADILGISKKLGGDSYLFSIGYNW